MTKRTLFIVGLVTGLLLVAFSVPLGAKYSLFLLSQSPNGMDTAYYNVVAQEAMHSVQTFGGIIAGLCGAALLIKK